ncbi:MAG: tetratricopeptide repeat protein [Bauldia sp.]
MTRLLTVLRLFVLALGVHASNGAGAANLANDQRLNLLFDALKNAQSERDGTAIENQIVRIWLDSGDAKTNLQMEWAIEAMDNRSYDLALDYLNAVVAAKPDYMEAWNKRATLFYMMGRYQESLRDIAETLAREPRHFGALAGRGMVQLQLGNEEAALEAFRQALAVDPQLTNIELAVRSLEIRLKQRRI